MKPYYDAGGITIYHGDCLDILHQVEIKPDTILGDPPYCSGGRQQATARQVFSKSDSRDTWFFTDNMGTDSYLWWMREIAGVVYPLASVGAHAYVFTDWRQYANLNISWETKGWTLRNAIVWDKARGGAMGSFWRSNHEWISVFSKGPPRQLTSRDAFNTWKGTKPHGDEHPTVKPVPLLAWILNLAGGHTVLDPWMGSGSTLVAAKRIGRPAIGIEIEERYCELAAQRLEQGVLPFGPVRRFEYKGEPGDVPELKELENGE
jgi:site-specific DNA-methyltransferase (adenine-specific)